MVGDGLSRESFAAGLARALQEVRSRAPPNEKQVCEDTWTSLQYDYPEASTSSLETLQRCVARGAFWKPPTETSVRILEEESGRSWREADDAVRRAERGEGSTEAREKETAAASATKGPSRPGTLAAAAVFTAAAASDPAVAAARARALALDRLQISLFLRALASSQPSLEAPSASRLASRLAALAAVPDPEVWARTADGDPTQGLGKALLDRLVDVDREETQVKAELSGRTGAPEADGAKGAPAGSGAGAEEETPSNPLAALSASAGSSGDASAAAAFLVDALASRAGSDAAALPSVEAFVRAALPEAGGAPPADEVSLARLALALRLVSPLAARADAGATASLRQALRDPVRRILFAAAPAVDPSAGVAGAGISGGASGATSGNGVGGESAAAEAAARLLVHRCAWATSQDRAALFDDLTSSGLLPALARRLTREPTSEDGPGEERAAEAAGAAALAVAAASTSVRDWLRRYPGAKEALETGDSRETEGLRAAWAAATLDDVAPACALIDASAAALRGESGVTEASAAGAPLSEPSSSAAGAPLSEPSSSAAGAPLSEPSSSAAGAPLSEPSSSAAGAPLSEPSSSAAGAPLSEPSSSASSDAASSVRTARSTARTLKLLAEAAAAAGPKGAPGLVSPQLQRSLRGLLTALGQSKGRDAGAIAKSAQAEAGQATATEAVGPEHSAESAKPSTPEAQSAGPTGAGAASVSPDEPSASRAAESASVSGAFAEREESSDDETYDAIKAEDDRKLALSAEERAARLAARELERLLGACRAFAKHLLERGQGVSKAD